MVTRPHTRTGDEGRTGLADGSRLPKGTRRIAALGDLDELNATLGVALAWCGEHGTGRLLPEIQGRLFELGAELARAAGVRMTEDRVRELEAAIDRICADLPPPEGFILPGGGPCAAQLHLARAVCRRAERTLWRLAEEAPVNPAALKYLNRLSDLLFVLARRAASGETPWRPESAEAPA